MNKVIDADAAVGFIPDGATLGCVGVIGWLSPDVLFEAIRKRFDATGYPRDLTFFSPVFSGDAIEIPGLDRMAAPGLLKCVVSGSFINPRHPVTGNRPEIMGMILRNEVEAYTWPIGATMHWLREVARHGPGYLTKIGLGTYVDPEHGGGALTDRSRRALVERVRFAGEDYLFYPSWPLDVALMRASRSDEHGNLSFERDPLVSASLALAAAVKASGGRVIAQVEEVVPAGVRDAQTIRVPGELIDCVVVAPDPWMTTGTRYDSSYFGGTPERLIEIPPMPPSADKVIARRAAREIGVDEVTIFGFGASSDIPRVMAEDGLLSGPDFYRYHFATEHGSIGGIVLSGWQFSANLLPSALIDGPSQFDLIDGGLCRTAALAFAEIDADGSVNVSRFGDSSPGAGGYIDIAHNARRLILTGTFTTGGLSVGIGNGIEIESEGRVPKFVRSVQQVTYRLREGVVDRGQQVMIITERAVFRMEPEGLVLIEIAPGVDVRTHVLDQMRFAPIGIAEPLPLMDRTLFERGASGFPERI